METSKSTIYQPNVITQARYSFTEYEMRVLLYVVKHIQNKLNKDDIEFNRNMFGEIDYKVQFYLADMMVTEGEKNHARIRKALKDLRDKSFEVEDEKQWFNVGFINYGRYNKDAKKWELQVSFLLMPYMVSLARGFTAYQLETILHLNTHSQRLYMMFSQYHDTGIFRISAEDLRYKLGLEKKYERYGDFKKWVLSAAEKELKHLFEDNKSDLWVKLEKDKKERGKEDFDRMLTFKIFYTDRKFKQVEQAKQEAIRYCINLLSAILPGDELYCNKLLGYLIEQKRLKPFADRLGRLEEQAQQEGKPLTSYGGLLRHIAKEDFKYQG
ncbi:replication initiation protein [Pontibacter qinzhouensis]|uniref:Replication initiation protein n=1 Tax=Pontibacter qinzhouensis TaxID=2603253 RepID=A0A5C8IIM8_9BACT|nr:replication initiation protein [Pontibacter qinzhouensis]TXK21157.1 replication initiation protein [Pontibacter qinzhouensis]